MVHVRVLEIRPVYKKSRAQHKRPSKSPAETKTQNRGRVDCQCQLVPVCMFCGEPGSSKVFVEGAFIVKGGKNGKLVDRYRGVAHPPCIEKHRKDWYAKNKKRALYAPRD